MDTATTLYNNYIGAHIAYALNQLGILSKLSTEPQDVQENWKSDKTSYLLGVAESLNMLQFSDDKISLTQYGNSIRSNIGFLTWAIGGYSDLLKQLPGIADGSVVNTYDFINGKYVAQGSDECNKNLMLPIFDQVMASLNFNNIADLGCGNAGKLIYLMNKYPNTRGLGIDINPDAIKLAQKNITSASLDNRIDLIEANVFIEINNNSKIFPEVDTVSCFMMFHDLLNMENKEESLFTYLNQTFPNVKTYIIADTVKASDKNEISIFTLGFELIHRFQNIQLFDLNYYLNYFKKAGFLNPIPVPFGVPNTYLFILKVNN